MGLAIKGRSTRGGNIVMICQRCHGLMVVDHFIDIQDGVEHQWLRGWQCVNCGEVVEPEVITSGKQYEVIPLGV